MSDTTADIDVKRNLGNINLVLTKIDQGTTDESLQRP